jgi:hypothetical protein
MGDYIGVGQKGNTHHQEKLMKKLTKFRLIEFIDRVSEEILKKHIIQL